MSARARRCAFVSALAAAACAGPVDRAEVGPASFRASESNLPEPASVDVDLAPVRSGDLTPSILLPANDSEDAVVARVGDVVVRESDVFARLLETGRRASRNLIDAMIIDAVVAAHAERSGIRVDAARIDELVDTEEKLLRERVQIEWGGRKTFEGYVLDQFDLDVDEYRRFLRLELARERYRSYVIRYLGLLEDRVEVRILANSDRDTVEDVSRSVRDGADFATLALRHSEDETRSDGGRMAPFSRAFDHPVARVAFELRDGQLSDPFEIDVGGTKRWCLVYCLRRMPGRPGLQFSEVRDELEAELRRRPLTAFEQKAFALRWCGELSSERTRR